MLDPLSDLAEFFFCSLVLGPLVRSPSLGMSHPQFHVWVPVGMSTDGS